MPKTNVTRNQQRKMIRPSCCFKIQKSISPPHVKSQSHPSNIDTTIATPQTADTYTITPSNPYSIAMSTYLTPHSILSPTLAISNTSATRSHASVISKEYRFRTTHDLYKKLHSVGTDVLLSRGYVRQKRIATTLQGEVFVAMPISWLVHGFIRDISCTSNIIYDLCYMYYHGRVVTKSGDYNSQVAIKTADKALHRQGVSISETGRKLKVHENMVQEAHLMSDFMAHNPPDSMIKYYDFFEDESMYYLVMEKAGIGLLEFTRTCHQRIRKGRLPLTKYRRYAQFIFAKMTEVTAWMHHTMNSCHLDISLENVVMADDMHWDERGNIRNLGIRFIDFGLTEMFPGTARKGVDYVCTKYVGKTGYKAPLVYHKMPYYAKKADVWSLGHCLFMLSVGSPLYKRPNEKDQCFKILQGGRVRTLLKHWDRLHYVTNAQYDLMMKMLCINQRQRITIKQVMNHEWMKPYFTVNSVSSTQALSPMTTSITLSSTSHYEGDNYCVVRQ
eukprot:15074_1